MATIKEKTSQELGLRINVGTGALIGLIGGILLGFRESITIIHNHVSFPFPFPEILFFSLSTIAIYVLMGCLVMSAIGIIMTVLIRIGGYAVNKNKLTGVYVGIFTLLTVSMLGSNTLYSIRASVPKTTIIELSLVSILCGLALGGLTAYILERELLPAVSPQAEKQWLGGFILLGIVASFFITFVLIALFRAKDIKYEDRVLIDTKDKPNILWIVMDTVRADHLSSYGYFRKTTPNIDKIASEGVLFENAISAAAWTLPSHASMFTGMFPSKHRTDGEHMYLSDNFHTIAEILQAYGYKTYGYSNNDLVSPETNLSQGFKTFILTPFGKKIKKDLEDFRLINTIMHYIQNLAGKQDLGAYKTNQMVKTWIRDSYYAQVPFFIFINYMETHNPYGDTPYFRLYLNGSVIPAKIKDVSQNPYAYISGKVKINNEDFKILRALYDADISYLDFRMGQLFDYLRELKILDSTLLIITSDHGENFGEHHLMSHFFSLYDTLLHVPLIIRYPKTFKANSSVEKYVQTTDIFPTILDILGIDWQGAKEIQGQTLVAKEKEDDLLFVTAEDGIFLDALRDVIILGSREFDASVYTRRLKAIRVGEFKYIWASDGRDELYNISEDPEELNNLIVTRPEKAKELKALLKERLH
jgi:arylsulfatase A-like enzyme